jgi:hypothetical protein
VSAVTLAVVRSLGAAGHPRSAEEFDDFEQELVDQYALASAGAGITDAHIAAERSVIFGFVRFMGRRVWTATADDADRFLVRQLRFGSAIGLGAGPVWQRRGRGRACPVGRIGR